MPYFILYIPVIQQYIETLHQVSEAAVPHLAHGIPPPLGTLRLQLRPGYHPTDYPTDYSQVDPLVLWYKSVNF